MLELVDGKLEAEAPTAVLVSYVLCDSSKPFEELS